MTLASRADEIHRLGSHFFFQNFSSPNRSGLVVSSCKANDLSLEWSYVMRPWQVGSTLSPLLRRKKKRSKFKMSMLEKQIIKNSWNRTTIKWPVSFV